MGPISIVAVCAILSLCVLPVHHTIAEQNQEADEVLLLEFSTIFLNFANARFHPEDFEIF